jgi:polyvinyl alcohol dehydrogenase (cytochrome)
MAVLLSAAAGLAPAQDADHPQGTNRGIYAFTDKCSSCHDNATDGAPDRYSMVRLTTEQVYAKLTTGSMKPHTAGLSDFDLRVISVYVAGRPLGSDPAGDAANMKNHCPGRPELSGSGGWNGWGVDGGNSRYQPNPGIAAAQVPSLKLKWAFGFPNGNSAYGQPAVAGNTVIVGSDTGYVYAINAQSGCVYWSYRARAGVRTAMNIAPGKGTSNGNGSFIAYFGDVRANVYAVDAQTGAELWRKRADTHPVARITGAPKLAEGKLFVPVSSLEESGAGNPKYPCCTFRGGVVAYDAQTGKELWHSYTIPEAPKPFKKTSIGTQLWRPAGAGVWSSPTIDLKRHVLYVATGNEYTDSPSDGSDAVVAFSLDTGKRLWAKQALSKDSYVRDCPGKWRPAVPKDNKSETCPEELGPDYDFGSSPMLRTLPGGKTLLVIGQKSGDIWAFDPDKKGGEVWHRQIGQYPDGTPSMVQWGSSADDKQAYFPLTNPGKPTPLGLAAVNLQTGETVWRANPPVGSNAASTVIPGVVFSGASNGTLYGYSTQDGKAIWQFNTAREFDTVNGVEAKGGNMNAPGPVIANGVLLVTSGSSDLGFGVRGNVLLAFSAE